MAAGRHGTTASQEAATPGAPPSTGIHQGTNTPARRSAGSQPTDAAQRAGAAALARHRRGLDAAAAGRPAAAADHFRAGLRLLEPDPPPGTEGVSARLLTSLAHAEAELGRVERGLELLDRAEPLGGGGYRAVVVSQRGLLLWRAGRYEAARVCFDEAVPLLADHADQVVLARVLLNRGGLHMGALRLTAARADLRRCEQIATACGAELLAAKAVHNRGYCELLVGDIPASLAAFETAEAGYREHGPGILPIAAVDRSRALLAAGLADEAAAGLETAITAFRDQRLSQDRAEAELALAQALAAAGKPAEAAIRARQAQRHFRARGNETWAALSELTRARADFAVLTEPRPEVSAPVTEPATGPASPAALSRFVPRAIRLADRLSELGLPHDAALARLLAARALIRTRSRDADIRTLIDAVHPRGATVPLELRLSAHLARAEFAALHGERPAALAELRTGLSHLHEQRRTLGSLDLQTGTAALGRELTRTGLRLALDSGSVRSVFAWSERSRAQAFRLRPVRPPDDPAVAAALTEYRRLDEILRTAELSGRSDPLARQRHAALQRQLREQSWKTSGRTAEPSLAGAGPSGAVERGEAPTTLAATITALDEARRAMISLLRQGDRLLALVIANGRASLVRLGSYARALEAAYRLQGDLDARVARRLPARLQAVIEASIRRQLDVLTAEVTSPVRPLIADLPVVVVPTGPLAAVPWSLLPDLRDRPVTVCPSAELWLTARRAQRSGGADGAPDPRPVLAAGPRLAHAEAEVGAIAGLYSDPVVLTGASATVAATLQAMDGAHTVHLAAHGHHERGNVMFARIDLADGPLMAYDLQRLSKPPQRVILSACEVGRAEVRSGDEHLGFTAALLYAGTSTVISSGTAVPDAAAPPLMAALHAALAAGATPSAALAAAMPPDCSEPFVCFGAG